MPKLFVFGIGGTGARVLKSLTMLLASGVKTSGFDIIPIIIDPHKDLPELKDCKNLLRLYAKINHTLYNDHEPASQYAFFSSHNAFPL